MPKKEYKLAFIPLTTLKRRHSFADKYDILMIASKEKPLLGYLLDRKIAPPVDTQKELPCSLFLENIQKKKKPVKVTKKGKKKEFIFFPPNVTKDLEEIFMNTAYIYIISS